MLGRALAPHRQDVIITTKVGGRVGKKLHEAGLSRRHILASVDKSLKRLGTDWIDSYVIHRDDPYTPMEETLTALDAIVRAGKVRYLGFSNWSAWRVAAAMEMMKANGLAPFTHGQMYYSMLGRDIENEFIPMTRQYGLGLTVWSPLAGGFLSGKYRRDTEAEPDSRYAAFDMMPLDRELGYDLLERMRPIADAHGASIPQVAIAWLLAKQAVTSVILGAAKPEQLDDNLKAALIILTPEEVSALDEASATPKPYPGWFLDRYGDRRLAAALNL
jgi:aryl-alcohol dehydrogenase-like predicted oxidoreductase